MQLVSDSILGHMRQLASDNRPDTLTLYRDGASVGTVAARVSASGRQAGMEGGGLALTTDLVSVSVANDAELRLGDMFEWDGWEWETVTTPTLDSYGAERHATAERRG